MTFDLLGQFLQHVNLPRSRLPGLESLHDLLRPLAALPARRALSATLVFVKGRQSRDGPDDVCALVHDDDGRRAQPRLAVLEGVKVHQLLVADRFGEDGRGRAAGDDGLEVVPATPDATGVLLNQLLQRNRHFFLHGAGVVNVTGNAEEFRPGVALTTERVEPIGATADDGRSDGDRFNVGDGGWASE